MVTSLCDRKCKYCCNKQYDLNSIPYVTSEELSKADSVFITGGEPFAYSNPCMIARRLKQEYNTSRVIVYTNAHELAMWLLAYDVGLFCIDGLTVSIKTKYDLEAFDKYIVSNKYVDSLSSNMLYVFDGLFPMNTGNFIVKERKWQENFVPAPNSIFRKI